MSDKVSATFMFVPLMSVSRTKGTQESQTFLICSNLKCFYCKGQVDSVLVYSFFIVNKSLEKTETKYMLLFVSIISLKSNRNQCLSQKHTFLKLFSNIYM